MNLISIEKVNKSYSDKILLNDVSLGINEGEKIGIIGINGTGKSTLLKIVAGTETVDSGNIIKGNKVRIEFLTQNPNFDEEATIISQVFKGSSKELMLIRDYEEILEKVSNGDSSSDEDLHSKLLRLQSEIDNLNLWNLESEAKNILTKLGITNFEAKMNALSGGQRKRVALASALITPCDLLILDEPTNHMDSDTIAWLQEYLNNRKGALLMITHDRYFLDVVANRILELDRGSLYSYQGNYSAFLEKKIEREAIEQANEEKRQNLLRKELAWVRRGAKARTTKQKARLDRFEELSNDKPIKVEDKVELSSVTTRLGKKLIEIENLTKAFGERTIIDNFSYKLLREDRIGIVGENGAGKTTFLRILTGELEKDSGTIEIGDTVKISIFSQESDHMPPDMRVIDYIKEIAEYLPTGDGERISASKMLERFLFQPEAQYGLIGKLSGGEKRRLYLLKVLMESPNVLILDEPTNDLDIQTLNILEDYIDDFNGIVLTVSHDRYFLDRICNKIFAYEGNGKITVYHGNFSDYLEKKPNMADEIKVEKKENKPKEKPKKEKQLKFTYKEQLEFETIDEVIEELENKKAKVESDIEKNSSDYGKLNELLQEKEKLELELEGKYDRWTYLNDLSEKIKIEKEK
ncbi:MAG: ABC-F family ATP-binding cassette domain-containing protein [Clostridiaceae bacterium]